MKDATQELQHNATHTRLGSPVCFLACKTTCSRSCRACGKQASSGQMWYMRGLSCFEGACPLLISYFKLQGAAYLWLVRGPSCLIGRAKDFVWQAWLWGQGHLLAHLVAAR